MTNLIEENIVDPSLREWIIPNFSNTTMTDTTVASIVMMATLKVNSLLIFPTTKLIHLLGILYIRVSSALWHSTRHARWNAGRLEENSRKARQAQRIWR